MPEDDELEDWDDDEDSVEYCVHNGMCAQCDLELDSKEAKKTCECQCHTFV